MTILLGDCREVMATMAAESVDALVTDPPAGIGFMSKEWDDFRRSRNPNDVGRDNAFGRTSAKGPEYGRGSRENFIVTMRAIFEECLRVLKPGAHGLVWALPRTSHWTATALEDAGFDVRDIVMHMFGTGFPKSHNLDGDWKGWGTALKPAAEHWILVRKPLGSTVAACVLAHGTGALNVDGCRIGTSVETWPKSRTWGRPPVPTDGSTGSTGSIPPGRWPANVLLSHTPGCREVGTRKVKGGNDPRRSDGTIKHQGVSSFGTGDAAPSQHGGFSAPDGTETVPAFDCAPDCPVRMLDEQSGERTSGVMRAGTRRAAQDGPGSVCYGTYGGNATDQDTPADSGGTSRFFLVLKGDSCSPNDGSAHHVTDAPINPGDAAREAGGSDPVSGTRFWYTSKASRADREDGLPSGGRDDEPEAFHKLRGVKRQAVNNHPTVKPTDLMRWLCKLVTPPNGLILDPFYGSGSTGVAAIAEGFRFIGIEREPEYVAIAERRIANVAPLFGNVLEAPPEEDEASTTEANADLFEEDK